MWIYYYVSRCRTAQIAEQVGVKLPSEQRKKWDISGAAKASAEAETSSLLSVMGLKAKAKGGVDTGGLYSNEMTFTTKDESTVEKVRQHLAQQAAFSVLDDEAEEDTVSGLHDLVRFSGDFVISLRAQGPERFAEYRELDFLHWEGRCGELPVCMVTSRGSWITNTPVFLHLCGDVSSLRLDGFATLVQSPKKARVALLPVFFGREVES